MSKFKFNQIEINTCKKSLNLKGQFQRAQVMKNIQKKLQMYKSIKVHMFNMDILTFYYRNASSIKLYPIVQSIKIREKIGHTDSLIMIIEYLRFLSCT